MSKTFYETIDAARAAAAAVPEVNLPHAAVDGNPLKTESRLASEYGQLVLAQERAQEALDRVAELEELLMHVQEVASVMAVICKRQPKRVDRVQGYLEGLVMLIEREAFS